MIIISFGILCLSLLFLAAFALEISKSIQQTYKGDGVVHAKLSFLGAKSLMSAATWLGLTVVSIALLVSSFGKSTSTAGTGFLVLLTILFFITNRVLQPFRIANTDDKSDSLPKADQNDA
jgi:hypothetical protein